jgi:hypothetical protein
MLLYNNLGYGYLRILILIIALLAPLSAWADDCISDPNECTPKKLCDLSTSQQGNNIAWSISKSTKNHVKFAQSLNINCGVQVIIDPCDKDPNECKISQLCEKATIGFANDKTWNFHASSYIKLAHEYGLACGVKGKPNKIELKSAVEKRKDDPGVKEMNDILLCKLATKYSNFVSTWEVHAEYKKHIIEAKSRGLTCGVKSKYPVKKKKCFEDIKVCTKTELCLIATYNFKNQKLWTPYSTHKKYITEAKSRGLNCGVKLKVVKNDIVKLKVVKNDIVRRIQNRLNDLGCNAGIPDGILGSKTRSALNRWKSIGGQYDHPYKIDNALLNRMYSFTKKCSNTKSKYEDKKKKCFEDKKECTNTQICSLATNGSGNIKIWSNAPYLERYITEAKTRGLSCGVNNKSKVEKPSVKKPSAKKNNPSNSENSNGLSKLILGIGAAVLCANNLEDCGEISGGIADGINGNPIRNNTRTFKNSGFPNLFKRTWLKGPDRMCSYTDGSIINIGIGICPSSL